MINKLFINIFLLLGLMLSGCHYHVGYPLDHTNIKTVYVAPAITDAIVPQMSAVLTRQIRENLIRGSHIKLAAYDNADVILETTITHYGRSVGTVDEADTDVAKTLSLSSTIKCSLKDRATGKYYFKDQSVSASLSINANTSAQAIEYQRLTQLSEKLAQKVVMLIFNLDSDLKE